jgi:hypothetical protein
MGTFEKSTMMAALTAVVLGAVAANVGPPTPNYAFAHGKWWNGSGYEARAVYTVEGVIRWKRPAYIDQTFDLHDRFVIPPLTEGHNHWVEPSKIDD